MMDENHGVNQPAPASSRRRRRDFAEEENRMCAAHLHGRLDERPSTSDMNRMGISTLSEDSAPAEHRVPLRADTVLFAIEQIERLGGLDAEGLYRESGQSRDVLALSLELVAGKASVTAHASPLNFAMALMRYLRLQTAPSVIPRELQDDFLAATTAAALREVCALLPAQCKIVLVSVTEHLFRVRDSDATGLDSNSSIAKMVANALVPDHKGEQQSACSAVERVARKVAAVALLLDSFDEVFPEEGRASILRNEKEHTGLTPEPSEKTQSRSEIRRKRKEGERAIAAAQKNFEESRRKSSFRLSKPFRKGKAEVISTPKRVQHVAANGEVRDLARTRVTKEILQERVVMLEEKQRRMEQDMEAMHQLIEQFVTQQAQS